MTLDDVKTISTQIADAISMPINPANSGQLTLKINRLTLVLAAASYLSSMTEWLLTYEEYLVMQGKDFEKLSVSQKKWVLKKETRVVAFYTTLTANQYTALLKAIDGLNTILTAKYST